jgi:hypothetical protein
MTAGFACARCGGFLGSAKAGGVRVCTACGAKHTKDGVVAPPDAAADPTRRDGVLSSAPGAAPVTDRSSVVAPTVPLVRTPEAATADRALLRRSGPGFLGVVGVLALGAVAVASAFLGVSALLQPDVDAEDSGFVVDPLQAASDGEATPTLTFGDGAAPASAWMAPTFEWTADRPASKGHLYAVGWLTNPNDAAMMSPRVVLQQRDAAGALLRDGFAYPFRLTLRPHERVPVSLLFDAVPDAVGRTWVTSGSRAFAGAPPAVDGLRVEGLTIEDPEYGLPEAKGRVVHQGRQPADRVLVELLSYDRKDVLIGVDQAYVAAEVLRPGETSHFSILLTSLGAPVARREAVASATVATPPSSP